MPDRSLRLPPLLLRERHSSAQSSGSRSGEEVPTSPPQGGQDVSGTGQDTGGGSRASSDDNPFAPPPEGTPDRPWQPRRPAGGQGAGGEGGEGDRSPWGSQWSDRQPGRATGGGFGERPRPSGGQGGQGGPEGGPGAGMRWDPTDPAQRRARFALLAGMWAFFFALFAWPYVALLLGALALHWGISSLRAKSRRSADPDVPAQPDPSARPQTTAAISGLVLASLSLAMVAATFTAQLVYRDYYVCTRDALTAAANESCEKHLPEELRGILSTR
ncbi:hypothetical protein [Streptomyces poonensis]|nr:hypothetical protein [Streptomyces poonensis]